MIAPTPKAIKDAREKSGLSQKKAALLVHRKHVMRWSEWERGIYPMPMAEWELFLIKTELIKEFA